MYATVYQHSKKITDIPRLLKETAELYNIERGQTFPCYHASAKKVAELIRNSGIDDVKTITFPADGKTAYMDKTSPLGWDASIGKITILNGAGYQSGTVIADFAEQPLNLIKGSVATAPGGEIVRILTYAQMLSGADAHDALVLLPSGDDPNFRTMATALDLGARGVISDYAMNPGRAPEGVSWCNAFTGHNGWHVNAGDRDFIAFSISPAAGNKLRAAINHGSVLAKVESDGRRFVSTIDAVTALIPGKRQEEIWILAHLYEPLSNDNSSGVAAALETARQVMKAGKSEFSLRLVFAMEYYGFAAYIASLSEAERQRVIGGCNYDAMYLTTGQEINLRAAAPGTAFFGNAAAKLIYDELKDLPDAPPLHFRDGFPEMYDDDSNFTDPTVGIPIVWPLRCGDFLWHNSKQDMSYIVPEEFAKGCALNTTFIMAVLNPAPELPERFAAAAKQMLRDEKSVCVGSEKEHLLLRSEILADSIGDLGTYMMDAEIVQVRKQITGLGAELSAAASDDKPSSPWRNYAEKIIPRRNFPGFPQDLSFIPREERTSLPDGVLYGPMAAVLANLDGKRTLGEAIRRSEHEIRQLIPEKHIGKIVRSIFYLARYGYIDPGDFRALDKADIVRALREAGVQNGDNLLVHSALGGFGAIEGGAETVIEALKEAVGENGTFLLPAFTISFAYLGGPNGNPDFRPFDPADLKAIWTGILPQTLLAKYPDAVRSRHITHSWCGLGKLAGEACAAHAPCDPPGGKNSPLIYMLKHHGKILHFGSGPGATTFLHVLEDELDLPGVATSLCQVRKPNGYAECVAVPRNFPDDRDFYHGTWESIKFFNAAINRKGLVVNKAKLGLGEIATMDIEQLYKIARELLEADPYLLLSDDENNLSCIRIRKVNEK